MKTMGLISNRICNQSNVGTAVCSRGGELCPMSALRPQRSTA